MARGCGNPIVCRVITILIVAAAVVMSCLTIRSCDFVKTSAGKSIGLFAHYSEDQCVITDTEMGNPYGWLQTWSRICAIIAPVFGAVFILMILVEFCCEICCWSLFRSLFLSGAEISQAFTFVLYGSPACATTTFNESITDLMLGGCEFSTGSLFSIIAFGLYLIAGFFLCFSPKQKPLCKKDAEEAKPTEVKREEEKPNDVEAGGAAAGDEGVKPQVY